MAACDSSNMKSCAMGGVLGTDVQFTSSRDKFDEIDISKADNPHQRRKPKTIWPLDDSSREIFYPPLIPSTGGPRGTKITKSEGGRKMCDSEVLWNIDMPRHKVLTSNIHSPFSNCLSVLQKHIDVSVECIHRWNQLLLSFAVMC